MKTLAFLCFWFLYFRYTLCNSPETENENVYEFLWENNKDIADETIKLDFLTQMQNGSLQVDRYIRFTIQEMNFAVKLANMVKEIIAHKIMPSDLEKFFNDIYSSYNRLANNMLQNYHFLCAPPIQQTSAMTQYLSNYTNLMDNEEPLYFAVGLLPCSRLWVWLAKNLNIPKTNAYYIWKIGNKDVDPEKFFKDLLNKYITPEKVEKANNVFRSQMQNERNFFLSS